MLQHGVLQRHGACTTPFHPGGVRRLVDEFPHARDLVDDGKTEALSRDEPRQSRDIGRTQMDCRRSLPADHLSEMVDGFAHVRELTIGAGSLAAQSQVADPIVDHLGGRPRLQRVRGLGKARTGESDDLEAACGDGLEDAVCANRVAAALVRCARVEDGEDPAGHGLERHRGVLGHGFELAQHRRGSCGLADERSVRGGCGRGIGSVGDLVETSGSEESADASRSVDLSAVGRRHGIDESLGLGIEAGGQEVSGQNVADRCGLPPRTAEPQQPGERSGRRGQGQQSG